MFLSLQKRLKEAPFQKTPLYLSSSLEVNLFRKVIDSAGQLSTQDLILAVWKRLARGRRLN